MPLDKTEITKFLQSDDCTEDVLRILAESRAHPEHFMPRVEDAYRINAKRQWFVLVTKPQCEMKAQKALDDLKLESYCPKITRWKPRNPRQIHNGKKLEPDRPVPLFRGYLIVAPPVTQSGISFGAVTELKEAHRFISGPDGPIALPGDIVSDLRAREEAGEFDLTRDVDRNGIPDWMVKGSSAYLGDGPFANIGQVLIEEVYASGKIDVRGNLLGKETKITVQADWLKKTS